MANIKRDKTISALEIVYEALKPLNAEERRRLLTSVHALLEVSSSSAADKKVGVSGSATSDAPLVTSTSSSTRPLTIRELILDKKPRTSPQLITLFAYFREKYENKPSFSRDDLKRYYIVSREAPPRNYDRDFVETVKRGWILEDDENSYITSKGLEAVASGFAGEEKPTVYRRKVRRGHKTASVKKRAKTA